MHAAHRPHFQNSKGYNRQQSQILTTENDIKTDSAFKSDISIIKLVN